MSELRVNREPERPRHPPTQIARIPQHYVHGYDQTAHMERLGLHPAEVSPGVPQPGAVTFTPHQGMPQQRHGTVPQCAPPSLWPGIVRDVRAIALGVILGLVILAVAVAVSRGFSL